MVVFDHLVGAGEQCHCGCDVDCHATNFHPSGVLVQTLRNLSRRLRGWPLISASIAAPPVTSAASPIMRTLRSVKLALLYLVLPEVIDLSQLALVSVMAEEWVYRSWSCASPCTVFQSPPIIAAKRLSSRARISFSLLIPYLHRDISGPSKQEITAREIALSSKCAMQPSYA